MMKLISIPKKIIVTLVSLTCFTAPALAENIDRLGDFIQQNQNSNIQNDPIQILVSQHTPSGNYNTNALSDPLLASQSAFIINNHTGQILYQKNQDNVMPIASISKLMAAMVVLDAHQNMNEPITITTDEIDRLKGTSSRLTIGTTLTRSELLHLSLMSSENRATHALSRNYPGGTVAFVDAMNRKAQNLGMFHTRFYDPTGLDFRNVSTARDLNKMVQAASQYALIKQNTTSNYGSVYTSSGQQQNYKNSNPLVREGNWPIELQKTGYIREAGRSMVVKTYVKNQPITMILLNSPSSFSRVNDARKIESWVQQQS